MGKKLPFLLFMILAGLILFIHLGMLPLWGSEGRWAVISRYMLSTWDLLHPVLGIKTYWDKPLLSYWQILPFAFVTGGVSEFTARIPSAIWALLMLILTHDIARRWFDDKVALLSAGVLLTSYGFVFWGRNAQVEMTNAALILLCLWYFFKHKSDPGHRWIYILGIIMGLAANMKGLTAYAVPIFSIMLVSLVKKDWAWMPPFKTLLCRYAVSHRLSHNPMPWEHTIPKPRTSGHGVA